MVRIRDNRAIVLLKYFVLASWVSLVCLGLIYLIYNRPMGVSLENIDYRTHIGTCAPNCKTDSLIRLGNQLNFDYATCPISALMRNNGTKRAPLHDDSSDDCPKVFLVDTRKGGTTSLITYLSAHPDFTGANVNVRVPVAPYHVGETDYFSDYYNDSRWSNYKALFVGEGHVLGDSSVSNFMDCRVPARIYKSCGDSMKSMKFIMLLRDPVDRFQSNYHLRVHYKKFGRKYNNGNPVNMSIFVNKEIERFYNGLLE